MLRNDRKYIPIFPDIDTEKQGFFTHYSDVIMSVTASQITRVSTVCLTVCLGSDQRKHQSSSSLSFVRGIYRWPEDSTQKGPVRPKMFPFDDGITNLPKLVPTRRKTIKASVPILKSVSRQQTCRCPPLNKRIFPRHAALVKWLHPGTILSILPGHVIYQ